MGILASQVIDNIINYLYICGKKSKRKAMQLK